MDERTTRSKFPKLTTNSSEATEAGRRATSGSQILGHDDRWMSKPRALNPQTKKPIPPKPPRQDAEPLQALKSSVTMTDG